jgi:IS5 family transposase
MEQLNYNLLFRWFVGLEIDDPVWNHAVFSKNRDRLLNQDLAQRFFAHVKAQAAGLMSDEHFTVDGTLIEAWAGQKSFRRKDDDEAGGGGGGDFHGEPRSNQTHASSTDPEARLYKKSAGQEAKLSYLGHALVENRNGLIAAAMTTQADGTAERDAALLMLHELTRKRSGRITTGADKAYDTRDFVSTLRELGVTPHVARRQNGAIDARTSRHPGYGISLSKRWLVEKPFGWLKQIGPLKKVKLRGLAKVDWLFVFSCAAFNLIRIPKLRAQSA